MEIDNAITSFAFCSGKLLYLRVLSRRDRNLCCFCGKNFRGALFYFRSGTSTNVDVVDYYRWLKKDFEAGEQRQCSIMNAVGFQGNGYWCLSGEVC